MQLVCCHSVCNTFSCSLSLFFFFLANDSDTVVFFSTWSVYLFIFLHLIDKFSVTCLVKKTPMVHKDKFAILKQAGSRSRNNQLFSTLTFIIHLISIVVRLFRSSYLISVSWLSTVFSSVRTSALKVSSPSLIFQNSAATFLDRLPLHALQFV